MDNCLISVEMVQNVLPPTSLSSITGCQDSK